MIARLFLNQVMSSYLVFFVEICQVENLVPYAFMVNITKFGDNKFVEHFAKFFNRCPITEKQQTTTKI